MEPEVSHAAEEGRFEIPLDEGEAYLAYVGPENGRVEFESTFVSPEHRGQGLAERVVVAALEWARAEGHEVVPTCPYVRKTMSETRPEFADLAADGLEPDDGAGGDADD